MSTDPFPAASVLVNNIRWFSSDGHYREISPDNGIIIPSNQFWKSNSWWENANTLVRTVFISWPFRHNPIPPTTPDHLIRPFHFCTFKLWGRVSWYLLRQRVRIKCQAALTPNPDFLHNPTGLCSSRMARCVARRVEPVSAWATKSATAGLRRVSLKVNTAFSLQCWVWHKPSRRANWPFKQKLFRGTLQTKCNHKCKYFIFKTFSNLCIVLV